MSALLHYGSQHPDQLAPLKQDLLAFYSDTVLGAKTVLPASTLSAYMPLIRSLSQQDFGKVLLPAILKYVRRTPEPALTSTQALLSATQLDLSSIASELLEQLLKLARGTKETIRYSSYNVCVPCICVKYHCRPASI